MAMAVSSIKASHGLLSAALVGLSMLAQAQPYNSENGERPVDGSKISNNLPLEYERWLDQEVRWIISPDERAVFTRLSNNADRDQFVAEFWRRRDPTPNTSENEYKEEHYRRLAYANTHFAASVPGWETDRGRTYIVYGPPDWIKIQPSRLTDDFGKPMELWHYLSIPGYEKDMDLKFVDVCGCGDYRLVTPLRN
jgi:GWxTD domain-containing protein